LNGFDHVLCAVYGDEVLGTALHDDVLLGRVVDANYAVTDSSSTELYGQVTQSTSSTSNHDPSTRFGICLTKCGVDCYTSAEEGCSGCGIEAFGDGCDVVCRREDVLLKGTWCVVS
jgi:hypothetical protein